jgi:hypothetical protein
MQKPHYMTIQTAAALLKCDHQTLFLATTFGGYLLQSDARLDDANPNAPSQSLYLANRLPEIKANLERWYREHPKTDLRKDSQTNL